MIEDPSAETQSPDKNFYKKQTDSLANGLLKIYQPDLSSTKIQLKELTDKQQDLLSQIHNENINISEIQHCSQLQDMFKNIDVYQGKLATIKRDIKLLHEKSLKLKKRAIKIQQLKEKQ